VEQLIVPHPEVRLFVLLRKQKNMIVSAKIKIDNFLLKKQIRTRTYCEELRRVLLNIQVRLKWHNQVWPK
jgi:hypothetical protein